MFKTILLAYDGSDHAKNALKVAAGLAKTYDAALSLVHTPELDTPPIVIGSFVAPLDTPPSKDQIVKAGQAIVDQAKAEASALGVEITNVHLGGIAPAEVILNAAKKDSSDLIVLGRRGLGTLRSLALGSVSQSVTHGAKCACLTVL